MRRNVLLAVAALTVWQSVAQAQVALKWNFKEPIFIDVEHKSEQDIQVLGVNQTTNSKIRFLFKVSPVKTGPDGTTLEHSILVLSMEDKKNGAGQKDTLKGLKDHQFQVKVAPGAQKLTLEGVDKLVEPAFGRDVKKATEGEKKFMLDVLNALLQTHVLDAYVPVPDRPVKIDDTWRNAVEVKVPPLAQMKLDREYKLKGQKQHNGKEVDLIEWTGQAEFGPMKDEQGVLPFKIKEMKAIGKPEHKGTILWDRKSGRPVQIDSEQSYEIDMVMDIQGKDVKGKGKGKDRLKTRILDRNPEVK